MIYETIAYPGSSGVVPAFLARPDTNADRRPGVLLAHEILGLNDHIRDQARRLAEQTGYAVLAPDLFYRDPDFVLLNDEDLREAVHAKLIAENFEAAVAAIPPERLARVERGMLFLERLHALVDHTPGKTTFLPDLYSAIEFLKAQSFVDPDRVAMLGFGYGGHLVNQMAGEGCGVTATVSYHAENPPLTKVPMIRCAMLAHYAGLDPDIETSVSKFSTAMTEAGKHLESHVYADVSHGFHNETLPVCYGKEAAASAWARSLTFLRQQLGTPSD